MFQENARNVFRKYKETMALITQYEEDVYNDWSSTLTEKISESLDQHLIVREGKDGTLKVNFGGDLRSLLREVTYPLICT